MITWNLTEQQADQVLNALAQRPFVEVNGLIGVLMQQAQEQQQANQQQAQQAKTRVIDRPLDAAESNRVGEATATAGQAINGLDQRV